MRDEKHESLHIYNADLYCEDCGDQIKHEITEAGLAPKDPYDEYSFDSDDFPKGPYSQGGGEADHPQHCGNRECQIFLENPLTEDGHNYVLDCLIENKGSGAIKQGFADPYFNGQNREFSLNIRFNPFLRQWYLEVFKADHKVRAYLPYKTIGLTVKQAGAIFRANRLFTWSKDGFSKTIDRKGYLG